MFGVSPYNANSEQLRSYIIKCSVLADRRELPNTDFFMGLLISKPCKWFVISEDPIFIRHPVKKERRQNVSKYFFKPV